jgi:hypothetical protein
LLRETWRHSGLRCFGDCVLRVRTAITGSGATVTRDELQTLIKDVTGAANR